MIFASGIRFAAVRQLHLISHAALPMRGCSFAGEFAQYLCQGVSLSGIAVLFMLLDRALAGCSNLDFLDSDQTVPNQALVQPALENIGEITPSRIYSHAEPDAGLARGYRIKGGYLRQFPAILSRLASKLASRSVCSNGWSKSSIQSSRTK